MAKLEANGTLPMCARPAAVTTMSCSLMPIW